MVLIVLAALVATRVVADGLWPPVAGQEGSIPAIAIGFTELSVMVAIVGGLVGAFKYGEIATELGFLRVRCATVIDEGELAIQTLERQGVSQETLLKCDPILRDLTRERANVERRMEELRVKAPSLTLTKQVLEERRAARSSGS